MTINEAWRIAAGYEVFTQDGKILRGRTKDSNGSYKPTYPYRLTRDGTWTLEIGVTLEAFRAAARRGTMEMK